MSEHVTCGPCCICQHVGADVRTFVLLNARSPVPGHGWGCLVCGLSQDGATAVVCDGCLDAVPHDQVVAALRFACRGYPGSEGRVPVAELSGSHVHDLTRHEPGD